MRPSGLQDVSRSHAGRLAAIVNTLTFFSQVGIHQNRVMTDLKSSLDTYAAIAVRRTEFDQLVWQVSVLKITAHAFLFPIASSPDADVNA
jgi:hypothetical protein